jgi:hypothetical protein
LTNELGAAVSRSACYIDKVVGDFLNGTTRALFDSERAMINQQPEKSRADRELELEHDTVDLTAEELRAVAGGSGVFLNIEVDKHSKTDGNPHSHGHHGKH